MMPRPRPPATVIDATPLFVGAEAGAHARLTAERAALLRRITALPPHSDRAVILRARLRDMTTELLRLETVLFARAM
jgi:hypothetical protein